jgi:predicted nuclease of restriction endonuclease-like (RecB) superfamily
MPIIDKLEHFMMELGKGFLFEGRQRRFTFEGDSFYVDLVFTTTCCGALCCST